MLIFYTSLVDTNEEKDKFEQIYYKYRKLMFYAAKNILNDDFLAEDAVQAAFLKIISNLHKINDVNCHKTKGFVVIVVENAAKTMYTKRKKNYTISFDASEYKMAEESLDLEDLIEDASISRIVEKITQLSSQDSDILILRYLDDLSNKEIAKTLNLKEAAVRKRLERARQRLAKLLSEGDL